MDIKNLTPEQRAELKAQIKAQDAVEKARIQSERDNYKELVDNFVKTNVVKLQVLSEQMSAIKTDIFDDAQTLIEMKEELFKTKQGRRSDSFSTSDSLMTLSLGNRSSEGWDDTVNAGIAKVKEYIATLARDDNSAALVETIMDMIAKDRKGNLKASKVLELEKLAIKHQDPSFLDGIAIIKAAYRPTPSCQFIEVTLKDEKGNEVNLPLSLAAMK